MLTGDRLGEATWVVWASLSDYERAAFHRFTCLRRRSQVELGVMHYITRQIRAEAGIYTVIDFMKEFDLTPAVLDNEQVVDELTALGVPHVPVAETSCVTIDGEFMYFVIRVRDTDGHGLEEHVNARMVHTTCDECKESCWRDPLSTPRGPIRTLCIACARRTLIRLRRAGQWPC